jgi:uncharacterized protein
VKRVFVDTSAFYALIDKTDVMHQRAVDYLHRVQAQNDRLISTDAVIEETYTLLVQSLGHRAAWVFRDRLMSSQVRVFPITTEIKDRAWQIARTYDDKLFSFVDCTSFAMMEAHGLHSAFTFDRHFEQYGFIVEPSAA